MRKLVPLVLLLAFAVPSPDAEAVTRVSNRQGFDKCFVPTIAQMKRWWDFSPYWNVNVYIGGAARACAQSNLTPNWVAQVHQQGWNFIPTWVGPQAPCSVFSPRFSWNATTARSQGVAEADKAIAAAAALGFTSPMIIYYDMEGYPDNLSCYNAVNAFMDGWGARMRARGHLSGGYGSACASGMEAWGNIQNWPHSAWFAHWIYGSYRASAGVWNVACVPNSYWQNHQRIRQYAGDHDETWGGVTFNIDSNALDGIVQGSNDHSALVAPPSSDTPGLDGASTMMANANANAVLAARRFATRPAGDIQALAPLDARSAWLATTTPPDDLGRVRLAIHATTDRGATWRTSTVHDFRIHEAELVAGPVWIEHVDTKHAYVAVRLASSSNFSRGMLFRTADGGATWDQRALPVGERVTFVDANVGFAAGGASGGELYVTHDGGITWDFVDIGPDEQTFVDAPTFTSDTHGVLPVTVVSATRPRVQLYTTTDKGTTWTLAREVALDGEPGMRVPVAIADATTWIVVDPASDRVHGAADATTWPKGIVKIEFENAKDGLVHTSIGACAGSKLDGTFSCQHTRRVMRTKDGGRTWKDETPADGDEVVDEENQPRDYAATGGGCNAPGAGAATGLALVGAGYGALLLLARLRRRRRSLRPRS